MYNVGVFISHSWSYSGHYETLSAWLFGSDRNWNSDGRKITFVDYSIPESDPIHNATNAHELEIAISLEMAKCHVVICPTGMYSTHSKWIGKELQILKSQKKKLLAVNPWGQEKKSQVVANVADDQVGWTAKSVAQGVFSLYLE